MELPAIEGSRRFICSYVHSLENVKQLTPEQIIKGKQPMGLPVTVRPIQVPPTHAVWKPPPADELKLNVDGGFMEQSGRAGTGMMLRRSDGTVVFSACRSVRLCASALEAELLACMEGLRFALDMSTQRIMIVSDCSELIRIATSKERDNSTLGHLVADLRVLLASDRVVALFKIPRLCNTASHELASFGLQNQSSQVWVGSVPEFLQVHIQKDCNNSMIS